MIGYRSNSAITRCCACGEPMHTMKIVELPTPTPTKKMIAECCVGKFEITLNYPELEKIASGANVHFGWQGQWRVE